jgi:hypothetical protein
MATADLRADKSSFAPLSGGRKKFRTWTHRYALGGGMKHWAASVVAILLVSIPGVVVAQANCEAMPHGPARTDCYLGLSQFYRGQSGLAAARAQRNQTPRGIEQLPEQTLRNTNHIGDDKSSDYSRAGSEKLRSCAPNFRLDLT